MINVLEALLDSWDRNHAITANLLRLVPPDAMELRTTDDGPSIVKLFTHMHYVRLVLVLEDAPELARPMPTEEWATEPDRNRLEQMLHESAKAVREAVEARTTSGREMERHYDHPILMLQHLIWHEGYHHGQIKLALKLAGQPIPDDAAGPLTWSVWFKKAGADG
jgi:uncharacterized damage-inducible protein DinB